MLSLRLIGVVESKSALARRIKHILNRPFPKSARLGLIGFTAILVIGAVCLPMAQGSIFRKWNIPTDTELSQVPGISLRKTTGRDNSGVTGSSSSGQSHSRQSFKSERLASMLGRVSSDYPVKLKTRLPGGAYAMTAEANGDQRMLLEQVCLTFSQSFDLDVSLQPLKQKVLVLTCPDPAKLKLVKSDRDLSCGFYKQEKEPDNNRHTRDDIYQEKFIVDMDELCAFAARHILANHDYKLTLVNETKLDGLYQGVLRWSPAQDELIITSLEEMGLKVSKAQRTVETVVVSRRDPAKDYSLAQKIHDPIQAELILRAHKYHRVDEPVHFTLQNRRETQVKFEKLPSMLLVVDGKQYDCSLGNNPYSGGTSSFTHKITRGRDKPRLAPGKHTVSVLFKDYDFAYKGRKIHVDELRSNEIEFEVVDQIPSGYFKPQSIAGATQILDDCHIKLLYLVGPTKDSEYEYSEHITVEGYTPPFNIAAKVYVESESGKKAYIKDLAIASTVGEVIRNNSFQHSLHKDFKDNQSQLNAKDLLGEKWRIILEPSEEVARTSPLIKRFHGQTYHGPYQDVQMTLDSFRFHEAGFIRKSHHPLSNFQRRSYVDMDQSRSSNNSQGADLVYEDSMNRFTLAANSSVSALKLGRTLSLVDLTEQMTYAMVLLSSGQGSVQTIDIRDGHLDLYALRSSEGNHFLLAVNAAEHNQNSSSLGGSSKYIEFSRFTGSPAENSQTALHSGSPESAVSQADTLDKPKTAILLPNIRKVLDLATGKIIDVPLEEKSQAECLAYARQHSTGGVMFDHDGKLSHLGFVNISQADRHTTMQSGIKMLSFVSKNMPQELTVTASDGQRYRIEITQAENEGCRLNYEQVGTQTEKPIAKAGWIELTLPDIDGSEAPAMLALDTHELVAFQDDSDPRAHEQWIQAMRQKPERSFLLYEYARNQASLIMVKGLQFLGIDSGSPSPKPIVHMINKTLPAGFRMTAPEGQIYEFRVLETDGKSCRLSYRLRPAETTEIQTDNGSEAEPKTDTVKTHSDADIEHEEMTTALAAMLVARSRHNDFLSLEASGAPRIEKRVYDALVNWSKQAGYNPDIYLSLVPWTRHNTIRGEFQTFYKSGWIWNQPKQAPPDVFLKIDLVKDGIWYVQGIDKQPEKWSDALRLELLVAEWGQIDEKHHKTLLPEARTKFSAVRKPNPKWIKTCKNGVQVEMAGVARFPSPGRQWWAPDGMPLGYKPVFCGDLSPSRFREQPGTERFEVAIALTWPSSLNERRGYRDLKVTTNGVVSLSRSGCQADREVEVMTIKLPTGQEAFDISVNISADGQNFETVWFRNVSLRPDSKLGMKTETRAAHAR